MTLRSLARRLRRDDRGQDLVEYAVIAAFVCLVALVGATTLGKSISGIYQSATGTVSHGANFTSGGSTSTTSAECTKESQDAAPAPAAPVSPAATGTTATTATCK